MDGLFFTSIYYFYWSLIIGGIFLAAAIFANHSFEQAKKDKKDKRPVKRNTATLLLGAIGILFLALYPLNNYLRTGQAGSQLKASSLENLKASPFTLYSLGDHPTPSLEMSFRFIDKVTVGPVPDTVYFQENYETTTNVMVDDTFYGQISVYEYANPASQPEQECNSNLIAGMAGIASAKDSGDASCRLLDSNNGMPIYGYSNTGAPGIDVMFSNYGRTRIVMRFAGQTLTLQQQVKILQQLKQVDPDKIRYFIPS